MNFVLGIVTWLIDWTCHYGGRLGAVLLLVGGAMGMPSLARAQVDPDSAQTQAQGVEPAALDSLSGEALEQPLGPPGKLGPRADTGDGDRVFVNADSLSALRRNGERIQELFGNVLIRNDTTKLRSAYARRFLNRDEVLFIEDVVIYERGDTLRADTVRYDRDAEVGRAWGNVRLTDGEVTVRARRGMYYAEEKRGVFPDSVVLVDSARVLRAAYGTYWSDDRRAEFGGGVELTEPNTTIHSDSLTFYRDRDRSIAVGDVFIDRRGTDDSEADSTSRTYLFGDRADNREKRRYSRVDGDALLVQVRIDSTGAPRDTLAVGANTLEAFRTDRHRRLVALDSVRIWQPSLAAVADSVVYDRVVSMPPDTSRSIVPIDTTRPPTDSLFALSADPDGSLGTFPDTAGVATSATAAQVDSVDVRNEDLIDDTTSVAGVLAPADSTLPGPVGARGDTSVAAWSTPVARTEEQLPLEEIRLFQSPMTWFQGSQVWGDSIRVRAQNRQPDTVFVRGSAFAVQPDSVLERPQQLKAKSLTAFFRADSLRRIQAQPNAEAIRFLATQSDSLNGAAKTSGDRIELRFKNGSVRRVGVYGGTETDYYRKNQNIPSPFHLDGFQWVPEREPTKAGLVGDERVNRWLGLPVSPPKKRETGPVVQRSEGRNRDSLLESAARPDSTAGRMPAPPRGPAKGGAPRRDTAQTVESPRADSIPAPPRPTPSPDTSETNSTPR